MNLWQDWIALALAAAAATYVVLRLWRRARRKGSCSGCTACARPLVQLKPQTPSENRGTADNQPKR
jgi:hypothetical protein